MAIGFCKTTLFGEHFVVYGFKGIAAQIDNFVEIKFIESENVEHDFSLEDIFAFFLDLDFSKVKIDILGTGIPQKGMGYSAAFNLAFVEETNKFFNKKWSDQTVLKIANELEKIYHKNPSGIDVTCAKNKGILIFQKNKPFKILNCNKKLHFLMVDSNETRSTAKSVEIVNKFKEEKPEMFDALCDSYSKISDSAIIAIKEVDKRRLGNLMKLNHLLLKKMNLSTPKIEEIIQKAKLKGCLGAKITGAGRGGFVLILCSDKNNQELLKSEFGDKSIKITL